MKFCPNADDYSSSVTYITLSRPALPSHGCQCDRSVEHVHDLDITREESRRSLRGPAELRFTSALLAAAGLVRTGPALELDRSGTDRPEPNLRPPITPDLEFLANSGVGVGRAPREGCPPQPGSLAAASAAALINPQTPPTAPQSQQPQHGYPTEARIRQKEQEKSESQKGSKSKRRPKAVEDHHDDCGHSLAGLPGIDQYDCMHVYDSDYSSDSCDDDVHDPRHHEADAVRCFLLWGPRGSEITSWPEPLRSTMLCLDFEEAFVILDR